jgi:hypothetical protein
MMLRPVLSLIVAALCATPCVAQTRLTSPAELERELAEGDLVTVVQRSGPPVAGRVLRVTADSLAMRPVRKPAVQGTASRDLAIPLSAILSLERPRDPVRNGALIGAGAGAGLGGAMFFTAFAIDRNEMDEWAPFYLGATAACTGIGALIGWAVDAARSKPDLRFDAASGQRATFGVEPLRSRGAGVRLTVAF